MDVRDNANPVLARARRWLDWVNARHPWNHNEHFHGWILRNLPARRRAAVDIGCGTVSGNTWWMLAISACKIAGSVVMGSAAPTSFPV